MCTSYRKPLIGSVMVLGVAAPLAITMFRTCSTATSERAPLVWAMVVDRASTLATNKLAEQIDSETYNEDAADLRLLERVRTLDVADDVLPQRVAQLLEIERKVADSERLRAEVLEKVDAVARDYDAVIEASQDSLLRRAVLDELARVPDALANIRADVSRNQTDLHGPVSVK